MCRGIVERVTHFRANVLKFSFCRFMDRVRNHKILLNKEVLLEGLFPTLEENFSASNTLTTTQLSQKN